MKISIGMNIQDGPFGGGNQFGKALVERLRQHDIDVSFDLTAKDLDLILLTDPRITLRITSYDANDIVDYLRYVNPDTLVIHRINECDERKNTTTVNQILRDANQYADFTIFVSEWLRDLHLSQGMDAYPNQVIRNGSDQSIFHADGHAVWDGVEPLRIVTHHWSNNWLKGFDIYQQLDELLGNEPFKSKFEFTYIGNIPDNFEFKHSQHVSPLSGHELASALREHHVYISASQFDPGPNHQNEGANCGLPLLYRPSGGLTEYCEEFGIAFTSDNLAEKLYEIADEYPQWQAKIASYPYTADKMIGEYLDLFTNLVDNRETNLARRTWLQNSMWSRVVRRWNNWIR